MSRKAGWYPDPSDDGREIYWDGYRWHGRREVREVSQPVDRGPSARAAATTNEVKRGLQGWWHQRSTRDRVIIVLASVGLAVGLMSGIASCSHDAEVRSDCERQATREGYRGSKKDQVVDFCVKYEKDFGGS